MERDWSEKTRAQNGSLSLTNGIWIENMKLMSEKLSRDSRLCLKEAKWMSEMIDFWGKFEAHVFDGQKREGADVIRRPPTYKAQMTHMIRVRTDISKCV